MHHFIAVHCADKLLIVAQAEGELQMLNTLAGSTPSAHSPRGHQHHHCFGAVVQQVPGCRIHLMHHDHLLSS